MTIGKYTSTGLSTYNERQVWSEITDAVGLDEPFRIISLVGKIPSILHLSHRSQTDIIREVLRAVEAEGENQCRRISTIFWELPAA